MKKLLVGALIVPLVMLGAPRSAKAGDKAAAILAGVAVGIGAALILDAITSPPVVAAPPPVVYQPAPVVVTTPPPVVYQPVVVHTPPPVVYQPAPVVVHAPPPVVYRPAPVIVAGPRHGHHPPHRAYHRDDHRKRDDHGKRHWKTVQKRRDD